jgi:hypothetical protein
MKALHREDLFGWSRFDEARNLDFHSVLWVRPEGNVVVDPLPLSEHDTTHLRSLGGVAWAVKSMRAVVVRVFVVPTGAWRLPSMFLPVQTWPLMSEGSPPVG